MQAGVDKCGDYIDKEFLQGLTDQGNQKDGVKCRFGHPNMCKESLGTYLGKYRNFSLREDGGMLKVFADLELDETAKSAPQGNLYDYVVKMATQNPDMFGNSIVCMVSYEDFELEGKSVNRLVLDKFLESDLVDSPAATDSLFKSSDDIGMKLTEFLDENPEVFDAISKDRKAIEIFFKKYANYCTTKNKNFDMSILKDIKRLFNTQKDIELTDANGVILTVITDAEQPAVGDKVTIDGAPASDAEYMMPDGGTIVTVGGVITEIESASEEAQPEPTDPAGEVEKQVAEAVTKAVAEAMASLRTEFKKDIDETNAAIRELAKNISSQFVPPVERNEGADAGKTEKSSVTRTAPLKG